MPGKYIQIKVMTHDGTPLGTIERKPANSSWRVLGQLPRINLHSHATNFPKTRECTGGDGKWVTRLYEGEAPPPRMQTIKETT